MFWTKEKPKTAGWYWFRQFNVRPQPVYISSKNSRFYVETDIGARLLGVDPTSDFFAGEFSSELIPQPIEKL